MGQLPGQSRLQFNDGSQLYRAVHIGALVSEDGFMSVTAGRMENSSRRMVFEHVGVLEVHDWLHCSDADFLLLAATINADEMEHRRGHH